MNPVKFYSSVIRLFYCHFAPFHYYRSVIQLLNCREFTELEAGVLFFLTVFSLIFRRQAFLQATCSGEVEGESDKAWEHQQQL